jgi:arginine deiminase
MSRLYVASEVGRLRRVILHRPELSLQRLTPRNMEDLLFDDVLRVSQAAAEHDRFADVLRTHGVEVLLLHDLLAQTLADPEARKWVLDRQVTEHQLGPVLAEAIRAHLEQEDSESAASALMGGLTLDDLDIQVTSITSELIVGATDFLLPPLPNHLYTRDTTCWIGNGVSINPMAKAARRRESVHLKAIYKFHPLFRDVRFKVWYGGDEGMQDSAAIEGGDVLVLDQNTVLMGMSERTTPQAVEMLALRLFRGGGAERVIAVQLPRERACMHLDTVLTQVGVDCFSHYPHVIHDDIPCWELTLDAANKLHVKRRRHFFKLLARVLGLSELRWLPTGGDKYAAEREQWNDANNVLTLRPGVVVGYERNVHTIEAMQAAGIEVLTIPGEELGRGRGGARCMSCPIERDDP